MGNYVQIWHYCSNFTCWSLKLHCRPLKRSLHAKHQPHYCISVKYSFCCTIFLLIPPVVTSSLQRLLSLQTATCANIYRRQRLSGPISVWADTYWHPHLPVIYYVPALMSVRPSPSPPSTGAEGPPVSGRDGGGTRRAEEERHHALHRLTGLPAAPGRGGHACQPRLRVQAGAGGHRRHLQRRPGQLPRGREARARRHRRAGRRAQRVRRESAVHAHALHRTLLYALSGHLRLHSTRTVWVQHCRCWVHQWCGSTRMFLFFSTRNTPIHESIHPGMVFSINGFVVIPFCPPSWRNFHLSLRMAKWQVCRLGHWEAFIQSHLLRKCSWAQSKHINTNWFCMKTKCMTQAAIGISWIKWILV